MSESKRPYHLNPLRYFVIFFRLIMYFQMGTVLSMEWSHRVKSWSGAMEWSFGVDLGVEWSQILSFCHPYRTEFYD